MRIIHIILILLSLLTSCGYKLQEGSKLLGKVNTVSVTIFKNKSSVNSAEIILTNIMIEELMRNTSVKVVDQHIEEGNISNQQNSEVDAIIKGTIVSISFGALARTSDDVVYRRGVSVVVNLEMKSRKGEVIFAVNNLTQNESYAVSMENTINETVINSTIEKIARQLARRLINQMSDHF